MKLTSTIARVLLGLIFVVFGLNGFLLYFPPPPTLPHDVAIFTSAMYDSHFAWMTSAVQMIAGLLLLANRYMLVTLVVLAAVLVNILTLHLTMYPQGLPPAIVAAVLWFLTAWPLRARFAPLFAAKVAPPA